MSTFLFDSTIFGPVKSRRLGNSLGINLLPNDRKICNFNCIYCECGWNNTSDSEAKLPEINEIANSLIQRIEELKSNNIKVDTITFAGNGEPTIHPNFAAIIDKVIEIRNSLLPKAKIAVLSNSALVFKKTTMDALLKADLNILKLDTAIESTYQLINQPVTKQSIKEIIDGLKTFEGKLIIQTMFVKGSFNNIPFDNTSIEELNSLIDAIKEIKPEYVMIYSIARDTPCSTVERIDYQKLKEIKSLFEKKGIPTLIF